VTVFRFIEAEQACFPISLSARLLGVSRSGFHAWRCRPPSDRALSDAWLTEKIKEIHGQSRGTYGSPRIHAELRRQGIRVGRKRVERLMRQAGLSGSHTRRKGKTTIRVQGVRVADDLVERDFNPTAPNRLWCADIKEIPTWEGKLYLASVLDCFSRRVVGWSMRDDMQAELVVDALEMAVARRRPGPGLVHHSDQGSQYVALVFGQRLRAAGIAQSMGSKGDCFDNAAIESYHATLEKDLLRRRSLRTKQEARTALFDYIETFYNRERLHSTLGYRSPDEFEHNHYERRGDCASGTDEMILNQEQARAA
jgi:putative transposase